MINLKEFIPLIKLLGKDKLRLIIASIFIFINGIAEIFTGYLNRAAVESITNLDIKKALIYLSLYFLLEITFDGSLINYENSILYKVESSLICKRTKSTPYQIDADIIYVVDKGKIVANGTHNELLKKNKIYKTLYETES